MKASNPPPPIRSPIIDENGYCTDIWQAFFNSFYNSVSSVPTGTIWIYSSNVVPNGWLLCNGAEVSRKNYVDLYSVVGNAFGAGDGLTTFNLPNLVDTFIRGAIVAGASGGADSFTITEANLPNITLEVVDPGHTHTFDPVPHTHNITDPKHSHSFTADPHHHTVGTGAGAGGVTANGTGGTVNTSDVTVEGAISSEFTGVTADNAEANGTNSTEETGVTVNLLGGGQAISLLPPYVSLVYIIKY